MSVCVGVCTHVKSKVAWRNWFKITFCQDGGQVCNRALGHYRMLRGHRHSHIQMHTICNSSQKHKTSPKKRVSLVKYPSVSFKQKHAHKHTDTHIDLKNKKTYGLPEDIRCKSLIMAMAEAMTLSLDPSFDCSFHNSECQCCYIALQAIHPNGTTDTHTHANRHRLLTYM